MSMKSMGTQLLPTNSTSNLRLRQLSREMHLFVVSRAFYGLACYKSWQVVHVKRLVSIEVIVRAARFAVD